MILSHDLGTSLSLTAPGRPTPLWTYVYGGKPKPYFHPLATPGGHTLSLFEPSDHWWHRGLWFTIKFVNGDNFWEEKDYPYNVQATPVPPAVTHEADGAIRVASTLEWRKADGTVVFDEVRTFVHRPIDQDAYALDCTFDLTPRVDVLLDRTPFTTWGGYGGLCFRGNRNWLKTRLLFDDGTTSDRPTPKPSKWCDLTGLIDGGKFPYAGVAIFDHPQNLRHPTPWYGGTGPGHYFNAAFLFTEPLNWPAGKALELRYRVLVHDGVWEADRLNAAWSAWA